MIDHLNGPGFFTMVAGTSVIGGQFALLAEERGVAIALGSSRSCSGSDSPTRSSRA